MSDRTPRPTAGTVDALGFDPFDRVLLTADGTVTSLLEARTGEPVTTRTTRQAGPATLQGLLAAVRGWWAGADPAWRLPAMLSNPPQED